MSESADRDYWTKGLSSGTGGAGPGHYMALILATLYLGTFSLLARMFGLFVRTRTPGTEGISVLAIGPFYSQNWTAAHLDALGRADVVRNVAVITPEPYDDAPGREYVVFSGRLAKFLGAGIARAASAFRFAIRNRPDLIIGYHLPWNGVVALLLGRMTGARAWYFSVGGPAEMIGGGRYSEQSLFARLQKDSLFIEKQLAAIVGQFDGILTMGSKSAAFFRSLTSRESVFPMAVGIDASRFSTADEPVDGKNKKFDIVTIGRHSKIKQVDVLLESVAVVHAGGLPISLVLVGDGEERTKLERLAEDLDITEAVSFAGWVNDVESYIRQSKVLVMTSASEGLPHSVIESMMAGLPAIVSDVGEISDLVEDYQTGFLVKPGNTDEFAARIREMLTSTELLGSCGKTASEKAQRYSVDGRVRIWNDVLASI